MLSCRLVVLWLRVLWLLRAWLCSKHDRLESIVVLGMGSPDCELLVCYFSILDARCCAGRIPLFHRAIEWSAVLVVGPSRLRLHTLSVSYRNG